MNIPEGWPTPEMLKAGAKAWDARRQGRFQTLFKAMLSAAPTPPEVEPIYQLNSAGDIWNDVDKNQFEYFVLNKFKTRELYDSPPSPADDELRKAAREFIDYFNAEYTNLTGPQIYEFLRTHNDKLTAALNKGKS